MKIKRTYILLALFFGAMLLIAYLTPVEVDWTPTYSSVQRTPYGSYVLYERLKDVFPQAGVDQESQGFYNFEESNYGDSLSNYLIVTDELSADDLDVRRMSLYAAQGNNLFIAAYSLPQKLQDTLGIKLKNSIEILNADSAGYVANLSDAQLRSAKGYRFRHENVSFQIADAGRDMITMLTSDTTPGPSVVMRPRTVLGTDARGNANFVRIPFGRGAFYIHSFPLAFTNYNMLRKGNSDYAAKCLSYMPDRHTHWDEYYKPLRKIKADTPLRFILSVPAYTWALYLALASMAMYMLFASKRTQRIIPTLAPPANLSLQFTRTIGSLYYQQRDHRDIAVKKMTYLLEKLRQYYFLQTADTSEAFRIKLSDKSNVSVETINEVFNIYEREIRLKRHTDEGTLIRFNTALEKFYQESGLINK